MTVPPLVCCGGKHCFKSQQITWGWLGEDVWTCGKKTSGFFLRNFLVGFTIVGLEAFLAEKSPVSQRISQIHRDSNDSNPVNLS